MLLVTLNHFVTLPAVLKGTSIWTLSWTRTTTNMLDSATETTVVGPPGPESDVAALARSVGRASAPTCILL